MSLASSTPELPVCNFFMTSTIVLLSDYWTWLDSPDHIHYPNCQTCKYEVFIKMTWKTRGEEDVIYSETHKHIFSLSARDITKGGTIPLPNKGKMYVDLELEPSGNFRLLSRSKINLDEYHSYKMALKDPLGLVWCRNTTAVSTIHRDQSLVKVPPPPPYCLVDGNRYTVRQGRVDFHLNNILLKAGILTHINLYLSSKAIDIICTISVSSSSVTKGESVPISSCAFGLMEVGLTVVSDVGRVTINGELYYTVDGHLHITGLFRSLLVENMYVKIVHTGAPMVDGCTKFENVGYVDESFGTKLNLPEEPLEIETDETTGLGHTAVDLQKHRLGTRAPLAAIVYNHKQPNRKCVCKLPLLGETSPVPPRGCPSCTWNGTHLTLIFDTALQRNSRDNYYLFIASNEGRLARRLHIPQSDTAGKHSGFRRPVDNRVDVATYTAETSDGPSSETSPAEGGGTPSPDTEGSPEAGQPSGVDPNSSGVDEGGSPTSSDNGGSTGSIIPTEKPAKEEPSGADASGTESNGSNEENQETPKADDSSAVGEGNKTQTEENNPASATPTEKPESAEDKDPSSDTPASGQDSDSSPGNSDSEPTAPSADPPSKPNSDEPVAPPISSTPEKEPGTGSDQGTGPAVGSQPNSEHTDPASSDTGHRPDRPVDHVPSTAGTVSNSEKGEPDDSTPQPDTPSPSTPAHDSDTDSLTKAPTTHTPPEPGTDPTQTRPNTPAETDITGESKFWAIPLFCVFGVLGFVIVLNIVFCVYTNMHPRIQYTAV